MHYNQFEFIARYKRMRGFNVFYPFGFDDNGLPTEKYVEEKLGVSKSTVEKEEFRRLCREAAEELIAKMRYQIERMGHSCDWSLYYHTIDEHCQKTAQYSFVDLYEKKLVYRALEPVLWCTYHQTAIAQAEVEDKVEATTLNYVVFEADGQRIEIATTRPELLGSCVAVFVHPHDHRYRELLGKRAKVPLFDLEVPIMSDEKVDMSFGTGIVMVCTFGDTTDIEWWRKHNLPLRISVTQDGKLNELGQRYAGLSLGAARARILEDLSVAGLLTRVEKLEHTVGSCWRCGSPIEFIPTKQWFIRTLVFKEELAKLGASLRWYPAYYKKRYINWVENLQWDWCISRQRYYGIPFPVWYCKACGKEKVASKAELPVDPERVQPREPCVCGAREWLPERDVMDTWMTSSLTPQITSRWVDGKAFFRRLFPMSMRPQAHDIIRTWAFYTILKAYLHLNTYPWQDVMISGHGLMGKGLRLSKSKGAALDPLEVVEVVGADALRLWSATGKLGEDIVFREQDIARAQKIAVKLWNASRFALRHVKLRDAWQKPQELRTIDRWLLAKLASAVEAATTAFEEYEISKARKAAEIFFKNVFCDYYIECVKYRFYGHDAAAKNAARYTLAAALLTILKLFAPFMPFLTEEIYEQLGGKGSIHLTRWPKAPQKDSTAERLGDRAMQLLAEGRKYKTSKGLPLSAELGKIELHTSEDLGDLCQDIKETLRAAEVFLVEDEQEKLVVID
jgi:valyl-tRNA synthetase